MDNESKFCIVHSQRLAGYLMLKGFILKSINESKKNNGKNIFVFVNSINLQNAISNFNSFKIKYEELIAI